MEEEENEFGIDADKIIEKVKDFINAKEGYFKEDRTSFERSQNLQAGNGWFERFGANAWGEARSSLTLNPLKSACDSTANNFLKNQFKFDNLDDNLTEKINTCLYDALKASINDGLGFVYMYHTDDGRLNVKTLSNRAVMWDYENEDDFLVIEKKKGEKHRVKASIWNNTEVLNMAVDEYPLLTYFTRDHESKTVKIYQFDNDRIIGYTELGLPHIPIIPVKCKSVMMKHDTHYRGYYWEYQDAVALMNACLSKAAEIAIARTPVALMEESLGDQSYIDSWQSNEPRNLQIYKGFMHIEGLPPIKLDPPQWAPQHQDLETLNNQVAQLQAYIDKGTGQSMLSENAGNETATAVLLRSEAKQDALSEALFHLNRAGHRIAEIASYYLPILTGQERVDIVVSDQLQNSFRNRNAIDMLLQLQQGNISPLMQLTMLDLYGAPKEMLEALKLQIQEASKQDPEKEQLSSQVAQLQEALKTELSKNELVLKQTQTQYDIKMAELAQDKYAKEIQFKLEFEKINIERAKLGLKELEIGTKADLEQQRINLKTGEQHGSTNFV